jgi:hypothetical protein
MMVSPVMANDGELALVAVHPLRARMAIDLRPSLGDSRGTTLRLIVDVGGPLGVRDSFEW